MQSRKIGYTRFEPQGDNDKQLSEVDLDLVFTDKMYINKPDKPELEKLIGFVHHGDHLYVQSMDRLAYDLGELRSTIETLLEKGVVITFIKETVTFDPDDSSLPNILLKAMSYFAEFLKVTRKEVAMEGIRQAKKDKKFKGSKRKLAEKDIKHIRDLIKKNPDLNKSKLARDFDISRETLYKYINGQ